MNFVHNEMLEDDYIHPVTPLLEQLEKILTHASSYKCFSSINHIVIIKLRIELLVEDKYWWVHSAGLKLYGPGGKLTSSRPLMLDKFAFIIIKKYESNFDFIWGKYISIY